MAEALILEFTGVGPAEYDAVNAKLGIDLAAKDGNWPVGLTSHAAGTDESRGTFVVVEVWSSREAQAAFMESHLGAALAAVGVSAPEVRWVPLVAYHCLET